MLKCISFFFIFWQQSSRYNRQKKMEKLGTSKGAQYKYGQIFGYKGPGEKILEEDIISVVKFDNTGRYLALGDNAGRVIVFQSDGNSKHKDEQLEYFMEFQSHAKEFDPLRSMQVEEAITGLTWLSAQGRYQKILSTNNRNIKLWKIYEKVEKKVVKTAGKDLAIPKLQNTDSYHTAQLQLAFTPKHLSAINSISGARNQQYLLSSDEVHCYMWNYQKADRPYLVADLLGTGKLEEAQESINFSKMHPQADNLFLYGTNKGTLKLCDMRLASNPDATAANFKNQYPGQKNFLTDFLTSYSSGDFAKQGKYIVSRDYLAVKVWDVCNSKKPINTIVLNDSMKGKLSEVFENEAIFDKFAVSASPDGNTIASGSYSNCFHLVDQDGSNTQFQLNYKKQTLAKTISGKQPAIGKVDYLKKTNALDYHPSKNIVAVASLNCFFFYGM